MCFFQWNQREAMPRVSTSNWKHCKMRNFLHHCWATHDSFFLLWHFLFLEAGGDYAHFSFCLVPFSHAVQRARPSTRPNRGHGGPELGQIVGEIIPGACDFPSSGRIFFIRFDCGRVCGCSLFNFIMSGFAGVVLRSTKQAAPILGASRYRRITMRIWLCWPTYFLDRCRGTCILFWNIQENGPWSKDCRTFFNHMRFFQEFISSVSNMLCCPNLGVSARLVLESCFYRLHIVGPNAAAKFNKKGFALGKMRLWACQGICIWWWKRF